VAELTTDAPPAATAAPAPAGRVVRDVLHGSGTSLVFAVAGHGATLASQVVLARWLTREEYGTFAFAVAILVAAVMVAQVGLPRAVVRFTAAARTGGEWGRLRATIAISRRFVLAASVAMSLAGGVALIALGDRVGASTRTVIAVSLCALPLLAVGSIQAQVLLGLRRIVAFQVCDKLVVPITMLVGVGLLFVVGWPGAPAAMAIRVLGGIVLVVVASVHIGRALRSVPVGRAHVSTREIAVVALPLLLALPLHAVMNRADVFLLGSLATMGDVALYDAAARVSNMAMLGLLAANAITSPMVAEHFAARQREPLQAALFAGALFATAFTVTIALVVTLGESLVLGMFGPEYAATAPALRILLLSQVFNSLMGPVGMVLTMTDHQRRYLLIIGVSAGVNVALNATLIPVWGVSGAAVADLATTVLRNCWMSLVVVSRLGLNPTAFSPAAFSKGRTVMRVIVQRAARRVRRR
jgi:O-antigen/teichoic acid export membrane protein